MEAKAKSRFKLRNQISKDRCRVYRQQLLGNRFLMYLPSAPQIFTYDLPTWTNAGHSLLQSNIDLMILLHCESFSGIYLTLT